MGNSTRSRTASEYNPVNSHRFFRNQAQSSPAKGPSPDRHLMAVCRGPIAAALTLVLLSLTLAACGEQAPENRTTPISNTLTPTPIFGAVPEIFDPGAFQSTSSPAVVVTLTPRPEPSETPIVPTPTFAAKLVRTTPDTRWEPCENAPPSRLRIGDYAYVSFDPFVSHRVRNRPSRSISSVLGLIAPGEVVEITDGPQCFEETVWWEVRSRRKDLQGWAQEGDREAYWFVPTNEESGAIVRRSREAQDCPVDDPGFCALVRELEPSIERGDLDAILAHALVTDCTFEDAASAASGDDSAAPPEERCAFLGVVGSGLTGYQVLPASFIAESWAFYAGPSREIEALLLPPFPVFNAEEVVLPQSPAVFVETQDPNWDWWISFEKSDGAWLITALIMVARDLGVEATVLDRGIPWP